MFSKDVIKVEVFKPRPAQEKWLDVQVDLKTDSPTEISRVAQLDKSNWYKWLEEPGFEDWYFEAYEKKIRRYRPRLDAIGMKESEKGSYNHWKDMQKFAGRVEQPAGSNVQVNILNAIAEQKKKYDL